MEQITLQQETIRALQNFLIIWRQDSASQHALEIYSNNYVILWNTAELEKVINITKEIEKSQETINIDEFISSIFNKEIEDTIVENVKQKESTNIITKEDSLSQIEKDLTQTIKPQTTSRVNPFLSQNWKDQLDKILRQLNRKGRTREDKIKSIEAYLYLGILIETQIRRRLKLKK